MKLTKAQKRDKARRKAQHGQTGSPKFAHLLVDVIAQRDAEKLERKAKRDESKTGK